jgi:hypothetical protein
MQRWNVNIDNDRDVLAKLAGLAGKMPDVMDLSELWQKHQQTKEKPN